VDIFTSEQADDDSIPIRLLADIKGCFTGEKMSSSDLIAALKGIEDSPWADWNKGKGLTTNGLARLLAPFDIQTRSIRLMDRTPKGYLRESFLDA
jgi:hypothetical protein